MSEQPSPATMRVQPIIFTGRIALWRDLLETIGLHRESGDDVFAVYAGEAGSVALHALPGAAVPADTASLPEGIVKLAWTVPDLTAFRRDADAAGFSTRLVHQTFGDELHVEIPEVGAVAVTQEEPILLDAPRDRAGVGPSLRVVARVDATDPEPIRESLEAMGWSPRFRAVDGRYVALSSAGTLSVARRESGLPTIGGDATAILALETDTPRTEFDRLSDLGLDVSLTEQSWGWTVSIPTPSGWELRLVQPPLDDPAYEYADPVEQAAADQVAVDGPR